MGVLVLHPCSQRSDQWRRSGVLTVVEAALLLYRALLSTPVWFKFFEEQNIGSILCSSCTGLHGPCIHHSHVSARLSAVPCVRVLHP